MTKTTANKIVDPLLQETSSQRILLEEYRILQSRFINLQEEGVTRMNFFLTAASLSLGSVLVFGGNSSNFPVVYFKIALLVILALLSIIDFYMCKFFVHRDTLADRYERGLARIRHYFLTIDPSIEEYFVTRVTDIPTNNIVSNTSGMRRTAQLIEGFLVGLAATLSATFFPLAPEIDIVIGFAIAIFVYASLEFTARRNLKKVIKTVENEMKFGKKANEK